MSPLAHSLLCRRRTAIRLSKGPQSTICLPKLLRRPFLAIFPPFADLGQRNLGRRIVRYIRVKSNEHIWFSKTSVDQHFVDVFRIRACNFSDKACCSSYELVLCYPNFATHPTTIWYFTRIDSILEFGSQSVAISAARLNLSQSSKSCDDSFA